MTSLLCTAEWMESKFDHFIGFHPIKTWCSIQITWKSFELYMHNFLFRWFDRFRMFGFNTRTRIDDRNRKLELQTYSFYFFLLLLVVLMNLLFVSFQMHLWGWIHGQELWIEVHSMLTVAMSERRHMQTNPSLLIWMQMPTR